MNQRGEQITSRNGTESSLVTLADALREAMDFERSSVRIYSHLADKVDSQVRPSILQLVSKARYPGADARWSDIDKSLTRAQTRKVLIHGVRR